VPASGHAHRHHLLVSNKYQDAEKDVGAAGEPAHRPRLRPAALIALAAAAVLLPTQALNVGPAALPPLLLVHGIHALIAGTALIASFIRLTPRQLDRTSLLFILGLAGNLLVYLYLLPYAVPTYPSLVSNALTC